MKNQLEELLGEELRGRVTYFLTRYHEVHNSYGRAAILLDKRELVCFSWIEMYRQERDLSKFYAQTGKYDDKSLEKSGTRTVLIMKWISSPRLLSSPICRYETR